MRTRAPVGRIWISATLYLAARVLGASESTPYPSAAPDYVVERVAGLPQVTFLAIDREGGVWVATLSDGVEHHWNGRLTRYMVRDGLASDHTQRLADLADSSLELRPIDSDVRLMPPRKRVNSASARDSVLARHFRRNPT